MRLPGSGFGGDGQGRTRACRLGRGGAPIASIALMVVTGTAMERSDRSVAGLILVSPATLPRLAAVDERYQSYGVEMSEIVGNHSWAPYGPGTTPIPHATLRGRIDLANARLRRLAAALGPAYVRVSGTWANSVYFHDADTPPPAHAPAGFEGVLTRAEWKSVVDFARAANARLVTSFAVSAGVRDAAGAWTPAQAARLLAYTRTIGGDLAAAEPFNEPTLPASADLSPAYDAAAYARDVAAFQRFARATAPQMMILGPGSVAEGEPLVPATTRLLATEQLLAAEPRATFDVFSYHFYGAVSLRCASLGRELTTTRAAALSEEWLARTDRVLAFYTRLRDRFAPGRPIWLTETSEAACGGDPWAATFLDTFRYLDQLGRLARRGVRVVVHQTLASSDYSLLDPATLAPRPNYWAALLWRRLMDTIVLDAGPPGPGLHLYAHCLRGHPGGVALLAIVPSRTEAASLALPRPAVRYTLTAPTLESDRVELEGDELRLGAGDALPDLRGVRVPAGRVALAPASITFLAIAEAGNPAC